MTTLSAEDQTVARNVVESEGLSIDDAVLKMLNHYVTSNEAEC